MSTTNKTSEALLLSKQNENLRLTPAQIKEQERTLVIMEYEHDNPPLDETPIFIDDSF